MQHEASKAIFVRQLTIVQGVSSQISITLLKQQDKKQFELLYDNYSGALYNIIWKIIVDETAAQDVLQESFLKIWRNIHTYDEAKSSIFTWMLNICRNTAIDFKRGLQYRPQVKATVDEVHSDSLQAKGIDENTVGLKQHIEKMKPEHYEVLHAVYMQGYSHTEAAEKLGLPLGTVKTRVRNALIELRSIYKS